MSRETDLDPLKMFPQWQWEELLPFMDGTLLGNGK